MRLGHYDKGNTLHSLDAMLDHWVAARWHLALAAEVYDGLNSLQTIATKIVKVTTPTPKVGGLLQLHLANQR